MLYPSQCQLEILLLEVGYIILKPNDTEPIKYETKIKMYLHICHNGKGFCEFKVFIPKHKERYVVESHLPF